MSKILIDARELRTTTGRYVERLIHYLQEIDNNNNYLILLKPKDIDSFEITNKNFIAVPCPYKEFTFREQISLLRQIKELRPDLVHFAMAQQPIAYRGRVVTTMHDLTTVRFRNPSKNWLTFTVKRYVYIWVNRIVAHKSIEVIVPSEFVKEDIAKFTRINSRKIEVTFESADKIKNSPEPIDDLVGKPFIMYTGRPLPHKNLERLIAAFPLIKKDYPDLVLVLAGKKDSLYRKIEKEVISSEQKDIVFPGFVSEGQLRWLYENCRAYVFPSLSEGFGLPGIEAMVHGAPVISSSYTCLPEIYGDAAEYFDPESEEDMAETILKVIKNESRRKSLVEKGYAQSRKYSWRKMATQTLEIYTNSLDSTK